MGTTNASRSERPVLLTMPDPAPHDDVPMRLPHDDVPVRHRVPARP